MSLNENETNKLTPNCDSIPPKVVYQYGSGRQRKKYDKSKFFVCERAEATVMMRTDQSFYFCPNQHT